MSISWFSIQASIILDSGDSTIVNYYFSVDNSTNLVIGCYNYNNIGVNVLENTILPYPIGEGPDYSPPVDNIFDISTLLFTDSLGFNYSDTSLQAILQTNTPYFNFFNYDNSLPYVLYAYIINQSGTNTDDSKDLLTNYINIQPISGPPSPFACFLEDSKILTDKGYIPIQHLRKGDLVKTFKHDFKPIYMIGKKDVYHPALQDRKKDQLYKFCQSEYTEIFEPLIITGCHSILVDSFISEQQKQKVIEINGDTYVTDEKYRLPACCDPRASIYETPGTYTIYHLALENDNYYMNYGIYANGLLVETCSKRYLNELSNMILIE